MAIGFKKKGQVGGVVGQIILLVVGVAVATLVLIFAGALGGQTYQLVEADIDAITNTTIKTHIQNAIIGGFEAQETTGNYMPLIVLAVVIFLVLGLVIGMTALGGGGMGRGTAL